jgi:Mlc titration factor MtfA (ptsG expression regulator)
LHPIILDLCLYESGGVFLAVILEHFFETPQVFKKEFPELYSNVRDMINFKDEDLFS